MIKEGWLGFSLSFGKNKQEAEREGEIKVPNLLCVFQTNLFIFFDIFPLLICQRNFDRVIFLTQLREGENE